MSLPIGFVPVLPLKNTVVFPQVTHQVRVGREKSIKALQNSLSEQNWIFVVSQKDQNEALDHSSNLNQIGTLCKIEKVRGTEESGFYVMLRGHSRMKITQIIDQRGFFQAKLEQINETLDIDTQTQKAFLDSLKTLSKEVLQLIPGNTQNLSELVDGMEDLSFLSHTIAANAEFTLDEKQKLLEMDSVREKTMKLLNLLQQLKESLKIQGDIRSKLNTQMTENHRQYILREQLKAIKDELGDSKDAAPEDLRQKIEDLGMSEDAKKLALQQVKRLDEIGTQSPEHHIIKSHLDFMMSLPWSRSSFSEAKIDLEKAREILDRDHYGMDKVKKRILQALAVIKLKNTTKGAVLLFVGPPGVGKTSLAQSIAEALGRKYVRVSVGGIRDDAEIRGHRRTYIGALAGRILNGIKKAGENDPVFVLDEIDKLSRGFSGDPASALLEVLDPEQNFSFLDHYLDVGFDISKTFFIGTANSLEGIPAPLLDRMEIIELSGYTTAEKFHIAKKYLIPKKMSEYGLSDGKLVIQDVVLHKVISTYTREAGVRELSRKIETLIRGSTERVLKNVEALSLEKVNVTLDEVSELLGQERYQYEVAETRNHPGVVTGLAWTPVGGDILFTESMMVPGDGRMLITGQLGDVMKESAQIGLTLLKARIPMLQPLFDFSKKDIHLHVPAGAIPKDGPSAGVTLLTSMASLFLNRSVDPKMAMTGEITLRGAVLPVGGIKEKVLAAHRAGIDKIILPMKNKRDIAEIPEEVKKELTFYFLEEVEDVLKLALSAEISYLQPLQLANGSGETAAASHKQSEIPTS
ncbi:MAG: endopeptidase La [Pseudobdellovibrionaceae bacterium]